MSFFYYCKVLHISLKNTQKFKSRYISFSTWNVL